jgi:hypothetical protein
MKDGEDKYNTANMKIQASAAAGTLYNSIVSPWFDVGRWRTLVDALDKIVFQKVVIQYPQRAGTDQEDNDDDRYVRNRIQTQPWFRSEERRDFLHINLGIRYAQGQVEWKEGLAESIKAKSPEGCRRCLVESRKGEKANSLQKMRTKKMVCCSREILPQESEWLERSTYRAECA